MAPCFQVVVVAVGVVVVGGVSDLKLSPGIPEVSVVDGTVTGNENK